MNATTPRWAMELRQNGQVLLRKDKLTKRQAIQEASNALAGNFRAKQHWEVETVIRWEGVGSPGGSRAVSGDLERIHVNPYDSRFHVCCTGHQTTHPRNHWPMGCAGLGIEVQSEPPFDADDFSGRAQCL